MKKYCLTQCAKDKLWRFKNIVSMFLTAILIIVGVVVGFFILGLIAQGVYVAITGSLIGWVITITESGLIVFLLTITIVAGGILLYTFYNDVLKPLFINTQEFVNDRINHKPFECKIFEVCEPEETVEEESIK